jgi:hypothetical protein
MDKLKVCIVFLICGLLFLPQSALAETYNVTGSWSVEVTFQTEAEATNVPPSINDTSFTTQVIAGEEVYPAGDRANATIPFAFTGEDLVFTIEVADDNGEEDIADGVTLFLSDDAVVDDDDISLSFNALESTRDGDVLLTFTKTWNVDAFAYGRKNVLISVTDSGGLSADNNGLNVGTVFINPQIGFEITYDTGEDIDSIQFPEGAPGTTNISAQNPLRIKNNDPDGVGMWVTVLVQGNNLVNQNVTGSIPIGHIKVDGAPMSTEFQTIEGYLASYESTTHMFSIDYPIPLPAGNYVGTVTFEIEAV